MDRRRLQIIAFCILSLTAQAEIGVYVKAHTIGRYDWDTNGVRTREPESTYTNAVLKYTFSYDDAPNVYDTSTNLNDGTFPAEANEATFTNGVGGAYAFTTDDYFSSSLSFTGAVLRSASCWFNITPSSTGFRRLFQQGANRFSALIWNVDDDVIVYYGALQVDTGYVPTEGVWHHLFAVRDVSNVKVYIDGVLRHTSGTLSGTLAIGELIVGATVGGGQNFEGLLDEVAYYQSTVPSNDVWAAYLSGSTNGTGPH